MQYLAELEGITGELLERVHAISIEKLPTRLDNETWPVDVESGNFSGRHHHKVKR